MIRISVIIPCAAKHVKLLHETAASLANQTSRPDEVVIAMNSPQPSDCETACAIFTRAGLITTIDRVDEPCNASQTRNRAVLLTSGDVVVCQDADDLSHPQRIEIIRAVFTARNDVDHLVHHFTHEREQPFHHFAALRHKYDDVPLERWRQKPCWACTNGNVAVRRPLLDHVRWPEHIRVGEDVAFNQMAARRGRSFVLPLRLLYYRQALSATLY